MGEFPQAIILLRILMGDGGDCSRQLIYLVARARPEGGEDGTGNPVAE